MDHNVFNGVGRLTKRPIYYPRGRKGEEHVTFTLAINRVVSTENGPQADYLPCSLWGPESRRFANLRDKGDEVGIIGRFRTNYVPRGNGKSDFYFEIRVEEVSYGKRSLKNLGQPQREDQATLAVGRLTKEFGTGG